MKLRIYGNIKDTKTTQAIIDANIKLFLDKKELQEVKSIKNGFFEIITEIDDSRIESGQQLRLIVEKEGYQKQEHRVLTTEGSFNLDVELEPLAPIPKKSFNRLPLIIGGGVLLVLLIGVMILWLLLRPKAPEIINFSLDSNSIDIGESATLHWDTRNVSLVKIEPGIGEVEPKGDIKVKPARTMEYILTAMNEKEKSISKVLTLEVVDKKNANELLDTSETIQTKSGGLNIMGSVGIGTKDPGANKLQVDGYTMLGGGIANSHFPWSGNGWAYVSGKGIIFREDAAGKYEERMRINDNGNIGIGTTDPGVHKLRVEGYTWVGGGIANSHFPWTDGWAYVSGKGIIFREDAAGKYVERMRINDNGNVGIGTTNPGAKLEVMGDVRAINFPRLCDARLKKNIALIENALDKVSALRGVVFEWRTEEYPERGLDEGQEIGLIAQEVEEVLPDLVSEDNDGYKSLDYSRFSPVLIEAIKELKAKMDELREENANLKERIAVLEEKY